MGNAYMCNAVNVQQRNCDLKIQTSLRSWSLHTNNYNSPKSKGND